jgi:hypothetical protein
VVVREDVDAILGVLFDVHRELVRNQEDPLGGRLYHRALIEQERAARDRPAER